MIVTNSDEIGSDQIIRLVLSKILSPSVHILFFYQFFFWKYQFFGLGEIFQFFEFRPLKKLETPKLDYFITIGAYWAKKRGTCYLGKPKDTTKRTKRHAPRARTANLHNTFVES